MDILIIAILIALGATFLTDYCNPYQRILKSLRMDIKPFNCSLCMSFWAAAITGVLIWTPLAIFLPFVTGMMQIIISRLIGLLPITLND